MLFIRPCAALLNAGEPPSVRSKKVPGRRAANGRGASGKALLQIEQLEDGEQEERRQGEDEIERDGHGVPLWGRSLVGAVAQGVSQPTCRPRPYADPG